VQSHWKVCAIKTACAAVLNADWNLCFFVRYLGTNRVKDLPKLGPRPKPGAEPENPHPTQLAHRLPRQRQLQCRTQPAPGTVRRGLPRIERHFHGAPLGEGLRRVITEGQLRLRPLHGRGTPVEQADEFYGVGGVVGSWAGSSKTHILTLHSPIIGD
jgi:hypothetical protein